MSAVTNRFGRPSAMRAKTGQAIRIQGLVQGVGFRPAVWRLARQLSLCGTVQNDSRGVLIKAWGPAARLDQFVKLIKQNCPALSRIDQISRITVHGEDMPETFAIIHSKAGDAHTFIPADAAICLECLDDTTDPFNRRYRYPFTNCTHCGPRLSIVSNIPYDRANTSMRDFNLCKECAAEYANHTDRRFHAQPNACHACGPKVWLERADKHAICIESLSQLDDIDAACALIQKGEIIAIKGIGGFQLACDALNEETVKKLRQRKQRCHKPFALMAGDISIIREYCHVSDAEAKLLQGAAAPIVILAKKGKRLPDQIAPGQNTLGFMLPSAPLHHLLLKRLNRPVVMTSGNMSEEPQCIATEAARKRLGKIADYLLINDREIVNRVDDSVARVMGNIPRLVRRARGYAPAPLPLPSGFENSPAVLAMGGQLKNTFCLIKDNQAILSQHIGDLEEVNTYLDYQKNLELYQNLFQHEAECVAIDKHPEYLAGKLGRQLAAQGKIKLNIVQHHHAHIASCLAENGWRLNQGKVLGVALDGLGFGDDGTLWGGEFLITDYLKYQRVATLKPVAMLGGSQAIYAPWRNAYAHLMAEMDWARLKMNFGKLDLVRFFESQPLDTFNAMLRHKQNAPLASSCGRLFDAVAAALNVCREQVSYEGQAAIELEAITDQQALIEEDKLLAYPFSISKLGNNNLAYIEPFAMWQALLSDLILQIPSGVIAARFQRGLAGIIVKLIIKLSLRNNERWCNTVALSGGVFQNKILFELVVNELEQKGFNVLTHRQAPANDGGLSLGQAVVAAAHAINDRRNS